MVLVAMNTNDNKSKFNVLELSNELVIETPKQTTKSDKVEFLCITPTSVTTRDYIKHETDDGDDDKKDYIGSCTIVYGIVGIIDLCFNRYVLVVTARQLATSIQDHKVWKITGGKCIPVLGRCNKQDNNQKQEALETELLSNITYILNSGNLFYCDDGYDITKSLQHNTTTTKDERYWFNSYLSKPITDVVGLCNPWLLKTICGFVGSVDVTVSSITFTVCLLSRLSSKRLGTRYIKRGLDYDGNAANSVEMEQIVYNFDYKKNNTISSFVQLRGSAPCLWSQKLDTSYRPEMK